MIQKDLFGYYSSKRPYFLSFVRVLEIPFYAKTTPLSGKTVDFGCGDGFFMETLARFSPKWINEKIIGLDLVKSSNSSIYQKAITYNGTKIPLKGATIDNLISNCVFEHIPQLTTSLKEIHRILKPGGRLLGTVMTNKWHKYCRLPNWFWDKAQVHHNLLTQAEWKQVFSESGFEIVKIKGYLNQDQSRFVESGHFWSLPYLLGKILFGQWQTFAPLYRGLSRSDQVRRLLEQPVPASKAAALFFELKKK